MSTRTDGGFFAYVNGDLVDGSVIVNRGALVNEGTFINHGTIANGGADA